MITLLMDSVDVEIIRRIQRISALLLRSRSMGFESLPERFNLISVTPSSIKTVLKRKERLSTRYLAFQFS